MSFEKKVVGSFFALLGVILGVFLIVLSTPNQEDSTTPTLKQASTEVPSVGESSSIDSETQLDTFNQGILAFESEEYEAAIQAFEDAINKDPLLVDAYIYLGKSYESNQSLDMAINSYTRGLEVSDAYEIYMSLLAIYQSQSDFDSFNTLAEAAYHVYPYEYDIAILYGKALENQMDDEKVVQHYNQMVTDFPEKPESLFLLPKYYSLFLRTVDCIQTIESYDVMNQNEDFIEYYIDRLVLFQQLDKAIDVLDQQIKVEPNNDFLYRLAALTYANSRYFNQSVPYFKKTAELTDDIQDHEQYLDILLQTKNIKGMKDHLLQTIDADEQPIVYTHYMAEYHIAMAEYDQAVELLESLLKEHSDWEPVYYYLALASYRMGYYEQATEYIDQFTFKTNFTATNYKVSELLQRMEFFSASTVDQLAYLFSDYYYPIDFSTIYHLNDTLAEINMNQTFTSLLMPEDHVSEVIAKDKYIEDIYASDTLTHYTINDLTYYMAIHQVTTMTTYDIAYAIQQISSSQTTDLILDLRNLNSLSDKNSIQLADLFIDSNHLLNVMNPNSDGSYRSMESMVDFSHIYILVNGETASSGEQIALLLKESLHEVTLIGEQTNGDNIGVTYYNDCSHDYVYKLLSYKWTINNINIEGIGITPDILISDEEISFYLEELLGISLKL